MYEHNVICPYCRSMHITTRNTGRKLGTAVGALGGGAHGLSSALSGARAGYTIFRVMGPPGMALGTMAGAVLGAIMGATSCGFMGAKLGELVDNTILDNYRCLHCGRSFNPARFIADLPLMQTPAITGASCYSAQTIDGSQIDEEMDEETDGFMRHWEQAATQHLVTTNHLRNKTNEEDFSTGEDKNTHSHEPQNHNSAYHHWPVIPYNDSEPKGNCA